MRAWLGMRLRFLADRVDPHHAFRATHLSFTFERGRGLIVNERGQGCRLWYFGMDDYEKAHTEADAPC